MLEPECGSLISVHDSPALAVQNARSPAQIIHCIGDVGLVITPLQAYGLRWQAMAARYQALQAQQAISERSNGVAGPSPSLVPQVVLSTSNGFDWRDAGIGASSAFALALILVIGVALIRRNQHTGLTQA